MLEQMRAAGIKIAALEEKNKEEGAAEGEKEKKEKKKPEKRRRPNKVCLCLLR